MPQKPSEIFFFPSSFVFRAQYWPLKMLKQYEWVFCRHITFFFSVFGFKTSRKLKQPETVEMIVKHQLKENKFNNKVNRCYRIHLLWLKHSDAEQCDFLSCRVTNGSDWCRCVTHRWAVSGRPDSRSQPLVLFLCSLHIILQTLCPSGGTLGTICSCPWLLGCTESDGGQEGEAAGGLSVCRPSPCCQTGGETMIYE